MKVIGLIISLLVTVYSLAEVQEPLAVADNEVYTLQEALELYGISNPDEKRLVLYEIDGLIQLEVVQEIDKFKLKREGVKFQDITEYWDQYLDLDLFDIESASSDFKIRSDIVFHKYKYPNSTEFHEKQVFKLIKDIDTTFVFDKLSNFTSFYSRYYRSDSGFESQIWLYEQILELIPESYLPNVNITLFDHKSWKQQSIIVSLLGENAVYEDDVLVDKGPVVVLGAHQDSANAIFPRLLKAPGADDDGSGSMTILETLRIILKNEIKFKNTVEFHFYSAEELGLLGSLDVFNWYRAQNITVISMLQQDMTGFISKTIDNHVPEHLGVTTDYTSPELFTFIVDIIKTYCLIPPVETKCGYACSDHSSALQNGYPSIMVIESLFKYTDPYIHSTSDTMDRLSLTHIAENVKMDLGYLYELGNWEDIQEAGLMKVRFGSLQYRIKRLFYSNFDAICGFMVLWVTFTTLVLVKLIKDSNIKQRIRRVLMRRKYHFLTSV